MGKRHLQEGLRAETVSLDLAPLVQAVAAGTAPYGHTELLTVGHVIYELPEGPTPLRIGLLLTGALAYDETLLNLPETLQDVVVTDAQEALAQLHPPLSSYPALLAAHGYASIEEYIQTAFDPARQQAFVQGQFQPGAVVQQEDRREIALVTIQDTLRRLLRRPGTAQVALNLSCYQALSGNVDYQVSIPVLSSAAVTIRTSYTIYGSSLRDAATSSSAPVPSLSPAWSEYTLAAPQVATTHEQGLAALPGDRQSRAEELQHLLTRLDLYLNCLVEAFTKGQVLLVGAPQFRRALAPHL